MHEKLAVAGGGAIACGLAATASRHGEVLLLARSEDSAARARKTIDKVCDRLAQSRAENVRIVTDESELAGVTAVIEAVVEDHDAKVATLEAVIPILGADALIGTTTSSLSVTKLGDELGVAARFVGLHVFNPVPRMKLIELAFGDEATPAIRERAVDLCEALDKTPIQVPDTAGFVVNRLLFPFLFSAVDFMVESGMPPKDIDACMQLGAGHPMGPLALLDYVGLDVSAAIGEAIGHPAPQKLHDLIAEGALGKKSGRGFYSYD